MSAIRGWKIIQVIRVIILPPFVLSSHICTTIATIRIVIMVVILMPPVLWTARSRGDILVVILWIIRPGITTISCSFIVDRDIRVSCSSNIRVPHTIKDIPCSEPLMIVLLSTHFFSNQGDISLIFGGTANIFAVLTTLNLECQSSSHLGWEHWLPLVDCEETLDSWANLSWAFLRHSLASWILILSSRSLWTHWSS